MYFVKIYTAVTQINISSTIMCPFISQSSYHKYNYCGYCDFVEPALLATKYT